MILIIYNNFLLEVDLFSLKNPPTKINVFLLNANNSAMICNLQTIDISLISLSM